MKYRTLKFNKINMIEADNESGLKIIVCPVGASIRSISFNNIELLNTPKDDPVFFSKESTLGKTLGPILNDTLEYEINGKSYTFNKDYSLNNVLFAGTPFLDKKIFSMTYSYVKKNMKDGLPGTVKYYISYTIATGRNEILVDYRVMSDRPTPISVSNNIQFSLDSENLDDLFIIVLNGRKKKFLDIEQNSNFSLTANIPIILENDKYKLEIESDYNYLNKAIFIDNPSKIDLLEKGSIYHHQILFKISKK